MNEEIDKEEKEKFIKELIDKPDKYVITCYLYYDEIKCHITEIIGDINKVDLNRKNLGPDDVPLALDCDEFILSKDITEGHERDKMIDDAMIKIKKEFPEETKFVLVNLTLPVLTFKVEPEIDKLIRKDAHDNKMTASQYLRNLVYEKYKDKIDTR